MRNVSHVLKRRLNDPDFIRKFLKGAIVAFLVSGVMNIVQVVTTLFLVTHPPRVRYVYHDSLGKPRELLVTDKPYFSDSEVINWTVDKVTRLHTLDFVHIGRELDDASAAFTAKGWNQWGQSFKASGNLDFIQSKRVYLTATLKSAATIEAEGVQDGAYEWRVVFPMNLKWTNESGSQDQRLAVTAIVRMTNDPSHLDGLEISELNTPRVSDMGN